MSDSEPDPDGFELPMPPDYDGSQRAAFREGWKACATVFASAAHSYVNAVEAPEEADDRADETNVCRDCGEETLPSMGSDETEYTPAGRVCPECEL